ncbi:putative periplasmic serine endoprotease DegP-like precursor [Pirellulimonas nuda]|uniref:Putative periplasmic serine endoprotease DegP-like n=1 Tax=Pirellulimonas nuda TaxID=2528009 RepID=A0A518D8M6_9BACT|nr:trypsin-like peptidase domain-containing protein [Pirellulimonas nuda]QDU87828.1 putative periplasmic serine endoprotease DegP-like precursor [Pirellulimonas nuda]
MRHAHPVLIALLLLGASQTLAQEAAPDSLEQAREAFRNAFDRMWSPPGYRLKNGPHVRAAFRDVVEGTQPSVVRVKNDGKDAALGGVVGPDGWVLTKSSQLTGRVTCRLSDGRELDAKIVGVDRKYDVAMLKVDAKDLKSLELADHDISEEGRWVATLGQGDDPIAVGVVSVSARRIPHQAGILGVRLEEAPGGGALIDTVYAESGAANAGIEAGDIIVSINQEKTADRAALIRTVQKYTPGDVIEIDLKRGDERLTVRARLAGQNKEMPLDRGQIQNNLGGELSDRRFGFPTAVQHDTVINPKDCGGPIVDLDGAVVGFNAARAGRTESYAIPSYVVRGLLFELMSGRLTPVTLEGDQHTALAE